MTNIQKLIFNNNVLDVSNISSDGFASGTKILFYQASAPTGWTIDASVNDVGVRIVSSNGGGVSGSTSFSSIFKSSAINTSSSTINVSNITTGATKLSVSQLASHSHNINSGATISAGDFRFNTSCSTSRNSISTTSVGSNSTHTHTVSLSAKGSHSHNITLNLKYINVLICAKD